MISVGEFVQFIEFLAIIAYMEQETLPPQSSLEGLTVTGMGQSGVDRMERESASVGYGIDDGSIAAGSMASSITLHTSKQPAASVAAIENAVRVYLDELESASASVRTYLDEVEDEVAAVRSYLDWSYHSIVEGSVGGADSVGADARAAPLSAAGRAYLEQSYATAAYLEETYVIAAQAVNQLLWILIQG